MKLAVILSGTLNTFYQNYLEGKYTFFSFLEEIGMDFDVFCCTEKKSFFKKDNKELAKQSAEKLRLINKNDRIHFEDTYLVIEESKESIQKKLIDVFGERIRTIIFTGDKQNLNIDQRYNEKIYLNILKALTSKNSYKYDTFILIRPDGIFQTIPETKQKKALFSLIKKVSKKTTATIAVNNPYPNVINENKYFFLRPNMHSPFILSKYGVLKFLELNFYYKYNLLSSLKIGRNYGLKAFMNFDAWKIKILGAGEKINENGEWRDMEHDNEMVVGEFLKKNYDEVLLFDDVIMAVR